jgi:excinuclease ABC subunit B
VNAQVLLYADAMTPAMQQAIDETNRRREKQLAYNREHGITPQTIQKEIRRGIELELRARQTARAALAVDEEDFDKGELLAELEKRMLEAAANLEFERAAMLRDQLKQVKEAPDFATLTGRPAKPKPGAPGSPGSKPGKKRKSRA